MNPTTIRLTPKDFFVQLGLTVALYAGVIALTVLAFDIVNYYFPDVLAYDYYGAYSSASAYSVRWSISMLIVLVPLTYILERIVRKEIIADPARKEVWIRKWRVYLTLFLTGAIIVGDLITLINTYLGGEISGRFIMKVLVVLILMGILFWLFLLERNADDSTVRTRMMLRAVLGLLALVAVVFGFVIAGSPARVRELQFDQTRVNDLSSIQSRVIEYWQIHGKMPETLALASTQYAGIPVDPQTKAPYEYQITTTGALNAVNTFSLCATFTLPSQHLPATKLGYADSVMPSDAGVASMPAPVQPWQRANDVWDHPAGRVCFDRTVDPKIYPPFSTARDGKLE